MNYFKSFIRLTSILALTVGILAFSCSTDDDTTIKLSDADKSSLLFMLEEEKMARDVYTALGAKWGSNQFNNIKESEQRHMNYVMAILDDNNVEYTVMNPGQFQNQDIQNLYDQFIENGSTSEIDAFMVGASIEDRDIYDLQQGISQTTTASIISTYEKLLCGSKNHMRAFSMGLARYDASFSPTFISTAEYDEILSGSNEHCG